MASETGQNLVADFVIVGAGSAGCVLANRLSRDPRNRVLLLEAGPDHRPSFSPQSLMRAFKIAVPAGFALLMDDPGVNWLYQSMPDAETRARVHQIPRGKVLGGSSAINGLIYARGIPSDYDGWRDLGCHGWSWAEVAPLFRRLEQDGSNGLAGGIVLSDYPMRFPATEAFLAACGEAGLMRDMDINESDEEGAGYVRQNTHSGIRISSAKAFLEPARRRPNLCILTGARATRVLFEGQRAVGVHFEQNGGARSARASREVILCGGVIDSPRLLQLSGVGDANALRAIGVEPLLDAPSMGSNFQDHFGVALQLELTLGQVSANRLSKGLPLLGQLAAFAMTRNGVLTTASAAITGYIRSQPDLAKPDAQLFVGAGTIDSAQSTKRGKVVLHKAPGMTITAYPTRPKSRGSVTIASADHRDLPLIRAGFLTAAADREALVAIVRRLHGLVDTPGMRSIVARFLPPFDPRMLDDDEAVLEFVRNTAFSTYHGVGTCRMGVDHESVVDPSLKVRGTIGLRVADGSIMPTLVSGNTNAPSMMIGEKAAELILAEA